MEQIITLLKNNKVVLLGMLTGLIGGYYYWSHLAYYWGAYPLSSECWVNCCYGLITGGFLTCLLKGRL